MLEFSHSNIVSVHDVLASESDHDIYLVMDLMDTDLAAAIAAGGMHSVHKTFIVYQLLKALKYIHSVFIAHRDVKPQNILLNGTELKIMRFECRLPGHWQTLLFHGRLEIGYFRER